MKQVLEVSGRGTAAALARLLPAIGVIAFVLMWHFASLRYPPFILPGPALVAQRFSEKLVDGGLLFHTATTLSEALLGLLTGCILALGAGYAVAKSRTADSLLSPFVVASQGVPFVAVAPLIFIWFGNGLPSKVLLCTLIVFFPVLVNVASGLRAIPQPLRDLFAVNGATRLQLFAKLEVPAALPMLIAGFRVGGTLAVVGAIAAEFVSANRGLGFLISQGNNLYDTPLVMVGVLTIVMMALAFYGGAGLLGKLMPGQYETNMKQT